MATFPQSREEADTILQELLAERVGKTRNEFQTKNLENALKVLSDTLYSKSTHFIAELIQNGDDNSFDKGVTPTLSFTLIQEKTKFYLLVECNEQGFSKEQVNAICSLGGSTKKQNANGKRAYTGEKGIGFKCVFKVANVIDIHSGHFQFRLDRIQELGMIMPRPWPFPDFVQKRKCTQMLLHLSGPDEYRQVAASLREFKAQQLLFLRRLERLVIVTPEGQRVFTTSSPGTAEFEMRTLVVAENSVSKEEEYLIVRHQVDDLPYTENRQGITSTEVVLGFPVSENRQTFRTQNAYAFLPVGNFGLRFILQADFILVTNRKALDEDLPWNIALRDAIPEAFMKAIAHVNGLSGAHAHVLRYQWPRYLQYTESGNTFWDRVTRDVIAHMSTEAVFESRDGDFYCPKDLVYVPKQYRKGSEPLIDLVNKKRLSFSYDGGVDTQAPVLINMFAIKMMTPPMFRQDLEDFATGNSQIRNGQKFIDMGPEWRNLVADALRTARSKQKAKLRELPLVPVHQGQGIGIEWVPACNNVYFPAPGIDPKNLPDDLNFSIVASDSCQGDWEELIRFLGVQSLDASHICTMIFDIHREPRKRKITNWVLDIVFLFAHQQHIVSADDLDFSPWLLSGPNSPKRYKADTMYIEHPEDRSPLLSRAADEDSPIHLVDFSAYATYLTEHQAGHFRDWLVETCQVSTQPRLVDEGKLTEDWYYFAKKHSIGLLVHLQTKQRAMPAEEWAIIRKGLERVHVRVRGGGDGTFALTAGLALPVPSLLEACPDLTFVDLPDPQNEN